MRSLRARLVAGLLALAAVGLLVLGGITYAEQRSFLLDRVDQQLRAAIRPVSAALASSGMRLPPGAPPAGPARRRAAASAAAAPASGCRRGHTASTATRAARSRRRTVQQGYGETAAAERPSLPAGLPPAQPTTVAGGNGERLPRARGRPTRAAAA